ncbi:MULTISPECIES: cadmium resistance transporter [unclassified Pseudonocardia]|uniref:cadmium resistance transporter n=1 Tax=unclassified Pseudonocardia TaxID=2619320 RepID=UPI001CF62CA7|nr:MULTISPECIES: cadmium resistance transporter [unclassified Pseudonocardia]
MIAQAAAVFAATNVDDLLVLALFFARVADGRRGVAAVVAGQYLGFAGILAASVAGALVAGLLPEQALPYLGLVPLLLGLRAARAAWREHHDPDDESGPGGGRVGVATVALVTLANGGDNLGVYVPLFATAGTAGIVTHVVVFLVLVGVWCALGRFLATRPPVARALARWGHVVLPVVLVGIGVLILVEGGAFGL